MQIPRGKRKPTLEGTVFLKLNAIMAAESVAVKR